MGGVGTEGGGPPPLAYMCSVHSNSKNYKALDVSTFKVSMVSFHLLSKTVIQNI